MEEIGDEWFCDDCHCHCEACNTAHANESEDLVSAHSSFRRNASEYQYCESCTFTCADCGNRFADDLDPLYNPTDDRICERCRENYSSCDSCGYMLGEDEIYSNDYGTYCRSCYEENEETNGDENDDERSDDERVIHQHSHKPDPQFQKHEGQGKTDLYFGLELEVDRRHASGNGRVNDIEGADIPTAFYCKEDGSLLYGFEVVSHPATWEWFASHDFEWANKLRKSGYRSYDTDTCGIHIHVSRRALTSLDILKLLEFFKLNPQFVLFISRRRADRLNQWAGINASDRAKQISKIRGRTDDDRYEAINLLNCHTIEFRIFRGTLSRIGILRNIGFVRTLIAYVKQSAMHAMSGKGYRAWLQDNAAKVLGRGTMAKALVKFVNGFESVGAMGDEDVRHRVQSPFADIAA